MFDMLTDGLRQATNLTGSGRLMEATAAIQRMLKGGAELAPTPAPASAGARSAAPAIDGHVTRVGTAQAKPTGTVASTPYGFRTRVPLGDLVRRRAKPSQSTIVVPDGAQFLEGSFTNTAGRRSYKVYVPSGYDAGKSMPLVVMLHGCTQNPDDFAAGTQMNDVAERGNFLVVYPAQEQAANMQRCWNWFSATDQARDAGEPSLIAGITRKVMAEYTVDPARVFVAGLSAGGAAASIMGHAYPELYAAIGVHSGLAAGAAHDMPSAFTAMRQGASGTRTRTAVPAIVFHGDRDPTVHPGNGAAVVAQSASSAATRARVEDGVGKGRRFTRTLHSGPDGEIVAEHWVIHGGVHAWSGGSANGSYADPQGPDASAEMMRFFLEVAAK